MDYPSAIIYTSMILDYNELVNGSSLSLPAHGRAGARATPFLAALFAKQKTKFGGGKARAGKNSFPPTPFLFARPSEFFSEISVGISAEMRSDFVQGMEPDWMIRVHRLGASPLASADEFSSNFQTSQSFFARRAKAKR